MARHWNWDFEDEPAERKAPRRPPAPEGPAAPAPAPAPSPPGGRAGGLPPARQAQIRRRRVGAVVVALVVLIALVALLAGSHGKSRAEKRLAGAAHAQHKPLTRPESDQNATVARVLA